MENISKLPTDVTSTRPITYIESCFEVETARRIIAEVLPKVGLLMENCDLTVEANPRFSCRMGDACNNGLPNWERPWGRIRISSHALWRRATPQKRRNTVIHELAHVLANCKAGRYVGHDHRWKAMMRALGEEPKRCHAVPREGLKRRNSAKAPVIVCQTAKPTDFRIGTSVSFQARGKVYEGIVIKRNRQTVLILTKDQRQFRVSPVLLKVKG